LIEKLCKQSNEYFRPRVKNIYSVNDWNKTDNMSVFLSIELIDEAIESGKQIKFVYNKYGADKKLHQTSHPRVSPYQLILHNQRYYLMGYSSYWGNMVFHRLDRISNMRLYDKPLVPLTTVKGYENGLDFKQIASTMPYMYTDTPERIELMADESIVDQIFDWFGTDIQMSRSSDNAEKIKVSLIASPTAMEFWALQYLNHVEVISPAHLRNKIKDCLNYAIKNYEDQ
jgi:predicted DNA-binding transcriptional regulator YafY